MHDSRTRFASSGLKISETRERKKNKSNNHTKQCVLYMWKVLLVGWPAFWLGICETDLVTVRLHHPKIYYYCPECFALITCFIEKNKCVFMDGKSSSPVVRRRRRGHCPRVTPTAYKYFNTYSSLDSLFVSQLNQVNIHNSAIVQTEVIIALRRSS